MYIHVDKRIALEKLKKALRYEYLVFAEKFDNNIMKSLKSKPHMTKWKTLGASFLEEMKKYHSSLKEDRTKYKRPFIEYCESNEVKRGIVKILQHKRQLSFLELYNIFKNGIDKHKYISFKEPNKLTKLIGGNHIVVGSKDWFISFYLRTLNDETDEGIIELDYIKEICTIKKEDINYKNVTFNYSCYDQDIFIKKNQGSEE